LTASYFVVVGDFYVPGDNVEQNSQVVDPCSLYNLHHLVSVPTHVSGNALDLMLLQDDDDSSIYAVGLPGDLPCHLGVPPTPPVVMTYSYQSLHTIHMAATTFSDRSCFRPL